MSTKTKKPEVSRDKTAERTEGVHRTHELHEEAEREQAQLGREQDATEIDPDQHANWKRDVPDALKE